MASSANTNPTNKTMLTKEQVYADISDLVQHKTRLASMRSGIEGPNLNVDEEFRKVMFAKLETLEVAAKKLGLELLAKLADVENVDEQERYVVEDASEVASGEPAARGSDAKTTEAETGKGSGRK